MLIVTFCVLFFWRGYGRVMPSRISYAAPGVIRLGDSVPILEAASWSYAHLRCGNLDHVSSYSDHDPKDIRIRLSELYAAKRRQVNETYAEAIEDARRSAEGSLAGPDVTHATADTIGDSLLRPKPGSTGLPILSENRINGLVYEAVVHWRLAGAGYHVTNLNIHIMDNFPIVDLVVHNRNHRLLVQVRGAAAESGSFRIKRREIERFEGWQQCSTTTGSTLSF
jgi:hypothetical protein